MKVPAQYVHLVDITISISADAWCAIGSNAKTGEILQVNGYPVIVPMDCLMKMQEPA